MPNYRYQCKDCDETFTRNRPISERNKPVRCPECDSKKTIRSMGAANVSCGSNSGPG
ncbi:MAG: FmdB family zinc ribbon protein [bacterium]